MEIPIVDRPLFFLDYDGTLAPIVEDPDEAHPHPDVPALLRALNDEHPVWIVTGRGLEALDRFLNLALPAIGLHGAQQGTIGGDAEHLMSDEAADALAALRRSVPSMEGLQVEDKEQAFAVHYRQAESEEEARQRLRAWVESMPQILDAIWGKKVVELRPKELTKGTAVRRIAEEHPDRTPIYVGDDVTDEDAFTALQAMNREAVTVKVARDLRDSAAQYRLDGPDEVVQYLQQYVSS
jgi:trehalose 6-phosphate phosphatase